MGESSVDLPETLLKRLGIYLELRKSLEPEEIRFILLDMPHLEASLDAHIPRG